MLAFSLAVCCSWFTANTAFAQALEDVIVEEYYVSNANDAMAVFGIPGPEIGSTTYRVFVDMAPTFQLQQITGFATNAIEFATTTGFYNPTGASVAFGENLGGFLFGAGAVPLDSYLSLGFSSTGRAGIPKALDTDGSVFTGRLQNTVRPINVVDGSVAPNGEQLPVQILGAVNLNIVNVQGASTFFDNNNSIFNLDGAKGATSANIVMIGQFTTTGAFSFKLNFLIYDNTTSPGPAGTVVEYYNHTNVVDNGGNLSVVSPLLTWPRATVVNMGCTNMTACNFDMAANTDDGSCIVPVPNCQACNATNNGLVIIDSDSDGTCNADDLCPIDANKTAPGTCGCGTADTDTDVDGTANCNDGCPTDPNKTSPGTCGCGVADADTDADGTANCNDGCPMDANKTAAGFCGCGNSDVDTNGNGVADCNDVEGCTNPGATNFNPGANLDDGTCIIGGGISCDGLPGALEDVIVEEYYVSNANDAMAVFGIPGPEVGSTTYRIFVDMAPTFQLQQITGFATNPLQVSTTTGFYNPAGASVAFGENLGGFLFGAGAVPLDSYFSLGFSSTGRAGIPKALDTDGSVFTGRLQNTVQPINVVDGSVAPNGEQLPVQTLGAVNLDIVNVQGASTFFDNNNSIFNLGGTKGATPDNQVLIGQFTTTGEFSFKLNFLIYDNTTSPGPAGTVVEYYTHTNVVDNGGNLSRICPALTFPPAQPLAGCTNVAACNFDALATVDNGSCLVPVANCSACNATNDGLVAIDDDNDGVCNALEVMGCTNPVACNYNPTVNAGSDNGTCIVPVPNCSACNASNTALVLIDSDGDGTCNSLDGCPMDANKTAPGTCGCGISDADSDLDGTANCNDGCPTDPLKIAPGTCGCNVADTDSDLDGTPNCLDLCPNDPNKTAPGTCGCSVADVDTDGDGVADCIDACPLLADLIPGDDCLTALGENGFVGTNCECNPGARPQCISPVACNYFDPTGLVEGPMGDYINAPELCDEPLGCKTCDVSVDADDVDADGNPTPDGDGIGAAIFAPGTDTNNNMICDSDEPSGCTSLTACNYNPAAVNNNGTCVEPALNCILCIPNSGGGFVFIDSDGDGICNAAEIPGCTNPSACNFNVNATQNNGSCLLPEPGCTVCSGSALVIIDTDGDGVSNCEEIFGCTNPVACNFDALATENNGSCLIAEANCTRCLNVFGQWVLLIIDNDNDGVCNADELPGCTNPLACNFNPLATDNNGSCIIPTANCNICNSTGTGLLIVDTDFDGICNANEIPGCTSSTACNFNANATDDNGTCLFVTPNCTNCFNGQLVTIDTDNDGICNAQDNDDDNDGCPDAVDANPLVASADSDGDGVGNECDLCNGDDASGDTDGDGICNNLEIPGCTNPIACNYNPAATDNNGSCVVPVANCLVCNAAGGLTLIDSDGDKICNANEIPGCQNPAACNYNPAATDNNGSCQFPVNNCTRCNNGVIELIDTDGDGVCDANEVLGCTNPVACNYNPLATDNNNTCLLPVANCLACSSNGTSLVLVDTDGDGVCNALEIPGCTNPLACNFNPAATNNNGSCLVPTLDCTKCGLVNGNVVLLPVDADGDGICDANEIPGCTNPLACNYNPAATNSTPTCIIPTPNCTACGLITLPGTTTPIIGLVIIDADGDKICNANEIPGCNNSAATNFNPLATDNDGSCLFACTAIGTCQGFEDGFGSWVNRTNDDINWLANTGGTPSNGTGPGAAFAGMDYLYIEASAPNYPGKTAILESPCYTITSASVVSFAYHMKGRNNSVGTLQLQASVTNGLGTTTFAPIFSKTGDQGGNWIVAQINVPAIAIGGSIQFRLVATTANSFLGDIAIDEFCVVPMIAGCTNPTADNYNAAATIDNGTCAFLNCANVRALPYCTSFNTSLGGFSQVTGTDDFNWIQQTGPTQSMFTGPDAANSGAGYVYVEASAPNSPFKKAQIVSPCINLSDVAANPDPAISFAYHMFGSYVGQLSVQVTTNNVDWTTIWLAQGNQGNQWLDASISLDEYAGSIVRVRFTGFTNAGWQGDMAIDDFCVNNDATALPIIVNGSNDAEALFNSLSKENIEFQAPEYSSSVSNLEVKLYPNPINPSAPLNVELYNISDDAKTVQVRIVDITGRLVYEEQFGVNGASMIQRLNLNADLSGGTYIVSIVAGDAVKAERLVITK